MREGPEDELTLTENAQPALMAVSMAVMRVLERGAWVVAGGAGALCGGPFARRIFRTCSGRIAGALADAARLLRTRGQAMQQAVPVGEGAMAALMGLELETVHDVARRGAQW